MLELPEVALWIEETGYFYKNGSQRIMTVGGHALLDDLVDLLERVNIDFGGLTRHRKRPLNKAFGAENCPCLTHLFRIFPSARMTTTQQYTDQMNPFPSLCSSKVPNTSGLYFNTWRLWNEITN